MNRWLSGFFAGLILSAGIVGMVRAHDAHQTPNCPQEDSCAIDYRDGAWHITEVQP
jgi:hypothetical protein